MDFATWKSLQAHEQAEQCQSLNPYKQWSVFKAVEAEFATQFGGQLGVSKVFCGLASGLGPCNAITVTIAKGKPRTKLPKTFLGFPVLREYVRS
jgi:hypothetical protein